MDHRMILVEVTRPYPRGKQTHQVGARIRIPEYAIKDATSASPPFVRVLDPGEVELDADFDATEGALDLARALKAKGFDLTAYAGKGSGENGRITKPDVTKWAEELGMLGTGESGE